MAFVSLIYSFLRLFALSHLTFSNFIFLQPCKLRLVRLGLCSRIAFTLISVMSVQLKDKLSSFVRTPQLIASSFGALKQALRARSVRLGLLLIIPLNVSSFSSNPHKWAPVSDNTFRFVHSSHLTFRIFIYLQCAFIVTTLWSFSAHFSRI